MSKKPSVALAALSLFIMGALAAFGVPAGANSNNCHRQRNCPTTSTTAATGTTTAPTITAAPTTPTTTTTTTTTSPPSWQATLENPVPPGSFWTRTLAEQKVAVDPNSAAMIQHWLSTFQAGDYGTLALHKWAVADAMTTSNDPTYALQATCIYTCDLDRFGRVPIPEGTKADPSSDGHLSILSPTGKAWEMWKAYWNGTAWTAGCGDAIDYATEYLVDPATCGSNDANLAQLPGLITPQELAAGYIDHPLQFASPGRGGRARCPANVAHGTDTSQYALPNGTLLRLDPTFNVDASGLPDWQKTIARALQTFGMYLADGSPNLQLSTVNPINQSAGGDPWATYLGWTGDYQGFASSFPWSRMQVMTTPC